MASLPWKIPQSISRLSFANDIWWHDPVTPSVAPWNSRIIDKDLENSGYKFALNHVQQMFGICLRTKKRDFKFLIWLNQNNRSLINYKSQIINPKQISKSQCSPVPVRSGTGGRRFVWREWPKPNFGELRQAVCLGFCACLLVFVCYLEFIIWYLTGILKKFVNKYFAKNGQKIFIKGLYLALAD